MSGGIESYRDLVVWQKAMDLAAGTYETTRNWPREELCGLTSQVRRCAVSVAANIAEGYGRDNSGNYVQFLRISQGSLKELETHLLIAERVGIAPASSTACLLELSEEIGKMLRQLIRRIAAG